MLIRGMLFLAVLVGLSLPPSQAADVRPAGFDEEALVEAARQMPRLESLLVSHGGELVLERYFNGQDRYQRANMKSASKSVISALVGIAIELGYIEGVDQPISDFFPALQGESVSAAKRSITVGNLLTMQAGLRSTSNRNYGRWVVSDNWVETALEQPVVAAPGTDMLYSTGSTHLLSAIITRASGMSAKDFAEEHLTSPMGFSMSYWSQDPQGIYFGGNDMEWTPQQMLAFGELYLNDGVHEGERVLSREWVARSHQPYARSPRGQGRFYGYGWWLRDLAGLQVPLAWGYGGQLIFVVDELDLVIVATSESEPGGNRIGHLRGLYDLVETRIIAPALSQQRGTAPR
ncbi:MAG: serine hydrolase [Pseudohongiellaceae bacterium]